MRHASSNGHDQVCPGRFSVTNGDAVDAFELFEGAGEFPFSPRRSIAVAVLPVPVEADVDDEDCRDIGGAMSTTASCTKKGWSSGIPVAPRQFSLTVFLADDWNPARTSRLVGFVVTCSTV